MPLSQKPFSFINVFNQLKIKTTEGDRQLWPYFFMSLEKEWQTFNELAY